MSGFELLHELYDMYRNFCSNATSMLVLVLNSNVSKDLVNVGSDVYVCQSKYDNETVDVVISRDKVANKMYKDLFIHNWPIYSFHTLHGEYSFNAKNIVSVYKTNVKI